VIMYMQVHAYVHKIVYLCLRAYCTRWVFAKVRGKYSLDTL